MKATGRYQSTLDTSAPAIAEAERASAALRQAEIRLSRARLEQQKPAAERDLSHGLDQGLGMDLGL